MRILCVLGILICLLPFNSTSQNLDLIVKTSGDSVACRIDSISENDIYLEFKYAKKWIHTTIPKNSVREYQYGVINKKYFDFIPHTSYINSKPKISSHNEAKNIRNFGATISLIGAGTGILGFGLAATNEEVKGLTGFFMMLAGGAIAVVGLPIYIIGASKVKRLERNINNTNTVSIELSPCNFKEYMAKNTQHGVSLKIKF